MSPGIDEISELALVRFERGGTRGFGVMAGDEVIDLHAGAAALKRASMWDGRPLDALLGEWERALAEAREIRDRVNGAGLPGARWSREEVRLRAPVRPGKLLFAGANYGDHRAEAQRWLGSVDDGDGPPKLPYLFTRFPETLVGPTAPIVKPRLYAELDYEVELGAVIGRPGKHIAPERALDHVAAFVVINDVSLRDLQRRRDWPEMATDWLAGKNFDASCPAGPYLVPRECVADYRALRLSLSVNGEVRQRATAGEMTFSLEEQIAFVSSFLTLNAGDLISTGTPSGVALASEETPWLEPGDVVEAEIDGLGRQRNPVIREGGPGDGTALDGDGALVADDPAARRT